MIGGLLSLAPLYLLRQGLPLNQDLANSAGLGSQLSQNITSLYIPDARLTGRSPYQYWSSEYLNLSLLVYEASLISTRPSFQLIFLSEPFLLLTVFHIQLKWHFWEFHCQTLSLSCCLLLPNRACHIVHFTIICLYASFSP